MDVNLIICLILFEQDGDFVYNPDDFPPLRPIRAAPELDNGVDEVRKQFTFFPFRLILHLMTCPPSFVPSRLSLLSVKRVCKTGLDLSILLVAVALSRSYRTY